MSTQDSATDFDSIRKEASNQYDLKLLGSTFEGNIIEAKIGEDKLKNKALFVSVCLDGKMKNGRPEAVVKQKYTSTIMEPFLQALEKLGYKGVPVNGDVLRWEQKREGRSTFPRWFPVLVVRKAGTKK